MWLDCSLASASAVLHIQSLVCYMVEYWSTFQLGNLASNLQIHPEHAVLVWMNQRSMLCGCMAVSYICLIRSGIYA